MPSTLSWIVFKIAQRCNLDCTYCYVYNRGDDSWKSRPPIVLDRVVDTLAKRINEQCSAHGLTKFVVEFHGGEPLLVGKRKFHEIADRLRTACTGVNIVYKLQTNGLLLDDGWLELLAAHNVSFGISLDGPPEIADRFRILRGGGGSTQLLLKRIDKLRSRREFTDLFGGILCVVSDPSINGATLVKWFASHGFDAFDFLLPDGNYVNYPPGWQGAEPYRRFLLEAFDEWYQKQTGAPQIRLFDAMMLGFLGLRPQLDALGGDLTQLCVIESDGSIGVSDVGRICDPLSRDSLNIFSHRLDEHAAGYRLATVQNLSPKCRSCEFRGSCGGGYLPHRYDGSSFCNPSIYCDALYALAAEMRRVLERDLPRSCLSSTPSPRVATQCRHGAA